MTRTGFIKSLVALFGVKVLPLHLAKYYHKIYLLQSFVRGFQFYEGTKLIEKIKAGDELILSREPNNEHDNCAIAIYFAAEKLGYIPRESNEILSRLLDAGLIPLLAEAAFVNTKAATWENLHVAVFMLKESSEILPKEISYLSVLEKPDYRTSRQKIFIETGDDFYGALVENSESDNIYDVIHERIPSGQEIDNAVKEMRFIVNIQRLPADLQEDALLKPVDNTIISLDKYFSEKGFVATDIDRIPLLANRLTGFNRINDILGRTFYEAVFK